MSRAAILYEEAVHIPAYVVDLTSFRRWAHSDEFPEYGKITFVKGEIIIDMSPEEITSHAKVRRDVQYFLGKLLESNDIGELLPDGTMFVNEEADVSNEPDLLFCSWDSLRSGRVQYKERTVGSGRLIEVVGSPDMVMEVVSRSSVRKDTRILRASYFKAGVQEYWLIDAREDEIDFQILVRGENDFEPAQPDDSGYCQSPVFGCRFLLSRSRNPVGGYRYQLDCST